MHHDYQDILALTDQPPVFWQQGGVPRFAAFSPQAVPDIYADEAALVQIRCQVCGHPFDVCFTSSATDRLARSFRVARNASKAAKISERYRISEQVRAGTLHYGDPPNVGCCPAGPTMSSEAVRVIEFHRRNHQQYVRDGRITNYEAYAAWQRVPELETEFVFIEKRRSCLRHDFPVGGGSAF